MEQDNKKEADASAAEPAAKAKPAKGLTKSKSKSKSKKKAAARKKAAKTPKAAKAASSANAGARGNYPKMSLERALRIPRAIIAENAGKPASKEDAAAFVGVSPKGAFEVELAAAGKWGVLDRNEAGKFQPSPLARQIIDPKKPTDELDGYRQAIVKAPTISDAYQHYRGENLPEDRFFKNTMVADYALPAERFDEFKSIFTESLETAQLLTKHGDKVRVVDISEEAESSEDSTDRIKKLGRSVSVSVADTCFVMQPFAAPLGDYYEKIYKPAIEKAGLTPQRADTDIFATGKIMDQIWRGINAATVLVAELTSRNPNVFYELGLAHALKKPVVLISSNEDDVPFDLQQIRVIYYDKNDPFWGNKLLAKVAENVLSAIKNPEEAIFRGAPAED